MKISVLKQAILGTMLSASLIAGHGGIAFAQSDDIDAQIASQQQILQELTAKRNSIANEELNYRIDELSRQLQELSNDSDVYDVEGAINSIAMQIEDLRQQLANTTATQERMMNLLAQLEREANQREAVAVATSSDETPSVRGDSGRTSSRYLVNPGPSEDVSYTQDAINAQGDQTMVFTYAPNQIYKIYCRRGYLTDLAFKKGEVIQFVGGGDTASWAVNNTTVAGVAHLYIKPVVEESTTNLIITTDKHSYQLILNTSDSYNPMVKWTYDIEDGEEERNRRARDEHIKTADLNAMSVEDLDFNYEVKGKSDYAPVMVFSDGEKTYMKFKKETKRRLPLFVRERNKKEVSLVNYKIKDNYYIVDKVFDMAQMKVSEDEIVTIVHK